MEHHEPANSQRPHPHQRLTCPTCRRPFTVPADARIGRHESLPFCCERCKLIDLGAWLDADYRIPARPDEESEEALPDTFND